MSNKATVTVKVTDAAPAPKITPAQVTLNKDLGEYDKVTLELKKSSARIPRSMTVLSASMIFGTKGKERPVFGPIDKRNQTSKATQNEMSTHAHWGIFSKTLFLYSIRNCLKHQEIIIF